MNFQNQVSQARDRINQERARLNNAQKQIEEERNKENQVRTQLEEAKRKKLSLSAIRKEKGGMNAMLQRQRIQQAVNEAEAGLNLNSSYLSQDEKKIQEYNSELNSYDSQISEVEQARADFDKALEVSRSDNASAIFGLTNSRQREFYRQIKAGQKAVAESIVQELEAKGVNDSQVLDNIKEVVVTGIGKVSNLELNNRINKQLEKVTIPVISSSNTEALQPTQAQSVVSKFESPTGILQGTKYKLDRGISQYETDKIRGQNKTIRQKIGYGSNIIASRTIGAISNTVNVPKAVLRTIRNPTNIRNIPANIKESAENFGQTLNQNPTKAILSFGSGFSLPEVLRTRVETQKQLNNLKKLSVIRNETIVPKSLAQPMVNNTINTMLLNRALNMSRTPPQYANNFTTQRRNNKPSYSNKPKSKPYFIFNNTNKNNNLTFFGTKNKKAKRLSFF